MPAEPLPLLKETPDTSHLPMIFILGNSHSGSTLLGFLLASNPHIINLGEIKSKTWLKERFCSCGLPVNSCPFYQNYFSTFNLLKQAAFHKVRSGSLAALILPGKMKTDPDTKANLHLLYSSISQRVTEQYPDARYWIDTSKSTWLLNAWLQVIPAKDIRIIRIKRRLHANVGSFVKRGSSFWSAVINIKINNLITSSFLKRNHLAYLDVNYDRFYDAYAEEAAAISAFLGLAIPSSYVSHHNHHAISGNRMTRQSFTGQTSGLRKDDEWKHILSGYQQKILSWLS